ncbi:hypothetical protein [Actinomadura sp. 7K507]|uniref:hypothetical protein n=1 Tax=Actinomadura sp. 7K507 TaxID=2530365 RepID=UPI001051B36E|nr:hypothetical protein [Actinomadura sp. 7K507]TDC87317.1 hypothetical protein E1285_20865 [Actinomadura sp. 7K507]
MTILSGLLVVVSIAMMATLVLLAVRRDRALARNAPGSVVARRPQATSLGAQSDSGPASPPAVR